jgi:hypothetical protein
VLADGTGLKSASMRSRVAVGPLSAPVLATAVSENGTPRDGVYGDDGGWNPRESEGEEEEELPAREAVEPETERGMVEEARGEEGMAGMAEGKTGGTNAAEVERRPVIPVMTSPLCRGGAT